MKKYQVVIALLAATACSKTDKDRETAGSGGIPGGDGTGDDGGTAATAGDDDGGPGGNGGGNDGTADDEGGPGGPGVYFDVGVGGGIFCMDKPAGMFCDGNVAVECGDQGNVLDQTTCVGDFCQEGTGCVECVSGQFDCQGPNVMACDDAANPPNWTMVSTCDPASNQVCDASTGTCIPLAPTGSTTPTGVYYQYAFFNQGDVYLGGYDVDSFEDRIFVNGFSSAIDVYEVQLLDSDGDGVMEPNQHPNNPDETGPIEERVLTFVESIPWGGSISISQAELYALDDRFYMGGSTITEMIMATGTKSVVTMVPGWASRVAQIAYDDVNQVWYGSNESNRRVFQRDSITGNWGHAFEYPPLAGDHMDGLEVVTDPETGIPYVYVSDMTSDFIGQYRKDPDLGWVQENLFEYQGAAGVAVEGMGFGALNHFWATGGSSLYEVGGGDLSEYTEPPG